MDPAGNGPRPRGFARYGTVGSDIGESRILAFAEPTLSLVTVYPPVDSDTSTGERLLKWYELYSIAKLEELHHGFYTKVGGIRNLRLLERKTHDELFQIPRKPPEKMKEAVVRSELACEKLFAGMIELIETHDVFSTFHRVYEGGSGDQFEDDFIEAMAQEMETDEEIVVDILSEYAAESDFERTVIDKDIYEDLQWLKNESESLTLPQLAVTMALDIPYTVSPITVSDGHVRSVEDIDFRDRFDRIMDAVRRRTIARAIDYSEELQVKVGLMRNAVNLHSSVELSNTVSYTTPDEFTLPLLDTAFVPDMLKERSDQQRVYNRVKDRGWWDAVLYDIFEDWFLIFGAVSPNRQTILLNPYVLTDQRNSRPYHVQWTQQFLARQLTEQILQKTMDGVESEIQDPLEDYELEPIEITGEEPVVPVSDVEAITDAFAEVAVDGEEELRRIRATDNNNPAP